MKVILKCLLTVSSLFLLYSAHATAMTVEIKGTIGDASFSADGIEIFHDKLVLPEGEPREIFTGPYTIQLKAEKEESASYKLSAAFFGLGPDFHIEDHSIVSDVGKSISLLPLPVKERTHVKYSFTILDDTATLDKSEPPQDDTTSWGISESVHYKTYWIKGSLADYRWNILIGYLEKVYDGFRNSFSISSFEKIEYILHPEPSNAVYMNPVQSCGIQPRKRRIDVVYSHGVDGVTPRSAAELLIYELWGYGPRWMVTGFSGYYFDNFLQLRKFAGKLSVEKLSSLLANEAWVTSDTGLIVTGAFSRWLIDNYKIGHFQELYKNSTSTDFKSKFEEIYEQDFDETLGKFLEFAGAYKPQSGELEYYEDIFFDLGKYEMAERYLIEAHEGKRALNWDRSRKLALCRLWLGDYEKEVSFPPNPFSGPGCAEKTIRANSAMAVTPNLPRDSGLDLNCPDLMLIAASYQMDKGDIVEASRIIAAIGDKMNSLPDYYVESGRLNLLAGKPADSLLSIAAALALNRARVVPHDPANYLVAGQAFMLMGDFPRAEENLRTSHFLETRPYFLGQVLLELGKLQDLKGERKAAREYYDEVLSIKAGAYQKMLAKKFLENKYAIGS
jgi:tetratricopeptide (TPR) repeat protein